MSYRGNKQVLLPHVPVWWSPFGNMWAVQQDLGHTKNKMNKSDFKGLWTTTFVCLQFMTFSPFILSREHVCFLRHKKASSFWFSYKISKAQIIVHFEFGYKTADERGWKKTAANKMQKVCLLIYQKKV